MPTTTMPSSSSSSSSISSSSSFIDCVMNHRWEEALELLQQQPTCFIEQRQWDDRNALHLVAAMACSFVNSTNTTTTTNNNNIFGGRGRGGRNLTTAEQQVDQNITVLLRCLEQWQQHIQIVASGGGSCATISCSSNDLWWTAMTQRDTRGLTPLLVACAHRAPLPIIEFLLRLPSSTVIPVPGTTTSTSTPTAAIQNNRKGESYHRNMDDVAKMKTIMTMTDRDGWTPLHYLVTCPYSTWEIEDELHQRLLLRQRLAGRHRQQGQQLQQAHHHDGTAVIDGDAADDDDGGSDDDEHHLSISSSSNNSVIHYTLGRVVTQIVEICPNAGLRPNNVGQTPLEFLALTFQTELERHCHSVVSHRKIKRRRIVHSSLSSSSVEDEDGVIGDDDGDTVIDFMTINNQIAHDVWGLIRMFVHAPSVSEIPVTSRSRTSTSAFSHKKSMTMGEERIGRKNDLGDTLLHRLASIRPTCPKYLFSLAVQLFPDQLLVSSGSDSHGNTPLHQAIIMKNTQLVSSMVEVNPGCCAIVNSKNQTPVCLAIELSSKGIGKDGNGEGDGNVGRWQQDVHGVLIEAYPAAVHKTNIPPALYGHLLEHWTKPAKLGTEQTFLNIQSWFSTMIPYHIDDDRNNHSSGRKSFLLSKLRKDTPRMQLVFELLRSGSDQLLR